MSEIWIKLGWNWDKVEKSQVFFSDFYTKLQYKNVIYIWSNFIWMISRNMMWQAQFLLYWIMFWQLIIPIRKQVWNWDNFLQYLFWAIEICHLFCRVVSFLLERFPKTTLLAQVKQQQLKNEERSLRKKRGWKKKVICMWYFLPYLALYGNKATSSLSINNFMLVEFYVLSSNSSNLSNSLFRILISHLEF